MKQKPVHIYFLSFLDTLSDIMLILLFTNYLDEHYLSKVQVKFYDKKPENSFSAIL